MLHPPFFFTQTLAYSPLSPAPCFFSFRISEVNVLKNVTASVAVFFSGFCSFVSYFRKLFPLQDDKNEWACRQAGELESQLYCFKAVWSRLSYPIFLSLSFFSCKTNYRVSVRMKRDNVCNVLNSGPDT